jgi:hypothetical protein
MIGRLVTLGIAPEATPYTAEASATYIMPNVEIKIDPKVEMAKDEAMLGSSFAFDDARPALQWSEVSGKMKVNEDILPMILKQKFSISSSASVGETVVYTHTMTYLNTNVPSAKQSFTLFVDDPAVADQKIAGFRFEKMDFSIDQKGFVYMEFSGKGLFPASATITNSISLAPNSFLGRHTVFQFANFGSALANLSILTLKLAHSFPLNGDDTMFELGSEAPTNILTLADEFTMEFSKIRANNTYRDAWSAGTKVQAKATISDTSRYVVGSVASTRPSIAFFYPTAKITEWSDEMGANDVRKETPVLSAIDDPAVATAPLQIVITNAVASY